MPHTTSSRRPQRSRQRTRQPSQRGKKDRRIRRPRNVRVARQPPPGVIDVGAANELRRSESESSLPTCDLPRCLVIEGDNDEEASAAAAFNAAENTHHATMSANVVETSREVNKGSNNTEDNDIRHADESIASSADNEGPTDTNRFDCLIDDESNFSATYLSENYSGNEASDEDSEGGIIDPNINHFNALMYDESSVSSNEEDFGRSSLGSLVGGNSNSFNVLRNDSESSSSEGGGNSDAPELEGMTSRREVRNDNIQARQIGPVGRNAQGGRGSRSRRRGSRNRRRKNQNPQVTLSTTNCCTEHSKCAVCFNEDDQSQKWRRLVMLPCCGSNGKEETSSTRFCAACILQMAKTRPHPTDRNEYSPFDNERYEEPQVKFYKDDCQTDNRRFIECPRCRDILIVNINKTTCYCEHYDKSDSCCDCSDCEPYSSRSADWTNPKSVHSISIHCPSFIERCQYAGKKVGVAKIFWRAAFLHHGFMPREALGGNASISDIQRLVSWGIIKRIPGRWNKEEIYKMGRCNQLELINFLGLPNIHTTKLYGEDGLLMIELLAGIGRAALTHTLREFRLDRTWRMVHRFFLLGLFFEGCLPPFPLSTWQEWVLGALFISSFALILQLICIFIIYAGSLFAVGHAVCFFLRRCDSRRSALFVGLISYFAFKLTMFLYQSSSILWLGIVPAKADVANIILG